MSNTRPKFLNEALKALNNPYATIASDGVPSGDIVGYVDTGSYLLNAILSGSMFKGLPGGKTTIFAGESSTGKTYLTLGICKNFLDKNENGVVYYFETEGAVSSDMLDERGIDRSRMIVTPVNTIKGFTTQCLNLLAFLKECRDKKMEDVGPALIVLDSLGMLESSKAVQDARDGKEVRDMTKAQEIRGMARVLTLNLAINNVTTIMTNHTYQGIGMFATKEMSGGEGMKYAGDQIVFLSKKKDKDGLTKKETTTHSYDVVGNVLTAQLKKGRLSKENSEVQCYLHYKRGLFRWFGLVDLAVEFGYFKETGNRIELPDGSKKTRKQIYADAETIFTQEVLEDLDKFANEKYSYGVAADKAFEEDLGISSVTDDDDSDGIEDDDNVAIAPEKPKKRRGRKPKVEQESE